MIRHELKYQFLHWRWLILIWWFLVFVNLGYQCQWWWKGQELNELGQSVWTRADEFHEVMQTTSMTLIWLGLSFSSLGAFLGITPTRSHSSVHARPLSTQDLIVSRIIWLSLFFGMPWWLHEFVYLSTQTGSSFGFCLSAVVLRIFQTLGLWLAFAAIGWSSRNFWQALLIPLIGILSAWGMAYSAEFIFPNSIEVEEALPALNGLHFFVLPIVYLFVAIIPLAALWWSKKFPNRARLKFWGTISLGGFVGFYCAAYVSMAVVDVVHRLNHDSVHFDAVTKSLAVSNRDLAPSPSVFMVQEDPPVVRWIVRPQIEGLPAKLKPNLGGRGVLTADSGSSLKLVHQVSQPGTIPNFFSKKDVNDITSQFPDATIFSGHIETEPMISLNRVVKPSDLETLDQQPSGQANVRIDLWESGEWQSLPFSSDLRSFSSLGLTRAYPAIDHVLNWNVRVRHFQRQPTIGLANTLKTHRQFAIYHPGKQVLVIPSFENYTRSLRGTSSASPFVEIELELPDSLSKSVSVDWFDGALLLMKESSFIGRTHRDIEYEELAFTREGVPTGTYLEARPRRAPELTHPIEFEFDELDIVSGEFARDIYEISRHPPDEITIKASAAIKPQLRETLLRYPPAIPSFSSIWNEDDRDWWLSQIDAHDSYPHPISTMAAQKGWFDQKPEVLSQLLNRGAPLTSVALQAAVRLELPGARGRLISNKINSGEFPVDRNEFPEEWWDVWRERFTRQWEDSRWALNTNNFGAAAISGIALGRMGEEAPLRELIEAYSRQVDTDLSDEIVYTGQSLVPETPVYQADALWENLADCFADKDALTLTDNEKKAERIQHWLDSEWEYQPQPMNYRLLP